MCQARASKLRSSQQVAQQPMLQRALHALCATKHCVLSQIATSTAPHRRPPNAPHTHARLKHSPSSYRNVSSGSRRNRAAAAEDATPRAASQGVPAAKPLAARARSAATHSSSAFIAGARRPRSTQVGRPSCKQCRPAHTKILVLPFGRTAKGGAQHYHSAPKEPRQSGVSSSARANPCRTGSLSGLTGG